MDERGLREYCDRHPCRSSQKTGAQWERRSSGSPLLLKIVSENRFSGKTYFYTIASRARTCRPASPTSRSGSTARGSSPRPGTRGYACPRAPEAPRGLTISTSWRTREVILFLSSCCPIEGIIIFNNFYFLATSYNHFMTMLECRVGSLQDLFPGNSQVSKRSQQTCGWGRTGRAT